MMKTDQIVITLKPDKLEVRYQGKTTIIKQSNKQAIDFLRKWKLPMNAFTQLSILPIEDQKFIKSKLKNEKIK